VPQISPEEFHAAPLRVHTFLADVPLHDVWAVDLPKLREGVTLDELLRRPRQEFSGPSRALFRLRFFLGRIFGLEEQPRNAAAAAFANRLTTEDRTRSSEAAGTPEGPFRVVYRFENEQLLEVQNRTVHGAALTALVETTDSYRYYFAIYVANVGWFTPLYMALIDPFRRRIIYPGLLKLVRSRWDTIS